LTESALFSARHSDIAKDAEQFLERNASWVSTNKNHLANRIMKKEND
jgi:hypothetical protein